MAWVRLLRVRTTVTVRENMERYHHGLGAAPGGKDNSYCKGEHGEVPSWPGCGSGGQGQQLL